MRRAHEPWGPQDSETRRVHARRTGSRASSVNFEEEDARADRRANALQALEQDLRERPPPRDYEVRDAEQNDVLNAAPEDPDDEFEADVRDRPATALFDQIMCSHSACVRRCSHERRTTLNLTLCLDQVYKADESEKEAVQWVKMPSDKFLGDTRLRVVNALLGEIDERGTLPAYAPLFLMLVLRVPHIVFEVRFIALQVSSGALTKSSTQRRLTAIACCLLLTKRAPTLCCRFHDAFLRACSRVLYREEWAVHRSAIMRHHGWEKVNSEVMVRAILHPLQSLRPRALLLLLTLS